MATESDNLGSNSSSVGSDLDAEANDVDNSSSRSEITRHSDGGDIAHAENRLVRYSKLLVIAVLLLTAAGCSAATYLFTSSGHARDFQTLVSRQISTATETIQPKYSDASYRFSSFTIAGNWSLS